MNDKQVVGGGLFGFDLPAKGIGTIRCFEAQCMSVVTHVLEGQGSQVTADKLIIGTQLGKGFRSSGGATAHWLLRKSPDTGCRQKRQEEVFFHD